MYSLSEDAILRAGRTWPQVVASGAQDIDEAAWHEVVDPDGLGLLERRLRWQSQTPEPGQQAGWTAQLRILRGAVQRGATPDPALATVPFGMLLTPIVAEVCARLSTPQWSEQAKAALRADLGHWIAQVTTAAFYADFTDSRAHGGSIMARLGWADGADSRYRAWCREQAADGLARLLGSYPVLGRLLAVCTMHWRSSTQVMLDRLQRRRSDLASTFGIDPEAPVTAIRAGLSDPHRGGHRVAIIEFGSTAVVYKPKDLRLEHWFHSVVEQVNEHFGDHLLHAVRVVAPEADYGFTGVVDHSPSPTPRLPDFYRAAGRLCALLYLLGATDAHHENVVAAGPSLALIDAETLFHIDLSRAQPWSDTVLRTGMLPTWTLAGPDLMASDPSALGVATQAHVTGPGWVHLNTDDMARATITRQVAPAVSCPVGAGQPNPLRDHVEDLVAGFREVYLDRQLRRRILDQLGALNGLPHRVVLRNTGVYATVQQQATCAPALTTVQARGLRLEQLSRAALVSDVRGPLWEVFQAELLEMENLDIPYFTHQLGTDEITGALGPVGGLIHDDPLAQAARRLRRMDDADWQEQLIRGSVQARFTRVDVVPGARPPAVRSDPRPTSSTVLSQVGQARQSGTWLALYRLPDGRNVRLGMIGDGWYDGRAGLAAVQDWAGQLHGDPALREAAAATIEPVTAALAQTDRSARLRWLRTLGLGFAGVGGLLRCPVVDFPDLPEELIGRDRVLDFVGGVAGLIGPLAQDPRHHVLVQRAAHQLAAAQLAEGGWPTTLGSRPLTGLAHGAAGMGLALLQAGAGLGRQEWIDAGARAFAYEDSLLADGNWPDLRETAAGPMVAWCHGAPGIGLARLHALQLLPEHPHAPRWHDDLSTAMNTTAAAPLPATDHLCCGLTGRAAILRICGRAMGQADWIAASQRLTESLTGPFTLATQGPVNPGLMTGLAGIAAHLLTCEYDADLGAYLA